MKRNSFWHNVLALALLLASLGGPATAQNQSGNLYGSVVDPDGVALPGTTLTLSGGGAPQVLVSDSEGEFHFLNLSPGTYQLKAELQGFSPTEHPNLIINVGRNTQIELTLTPTFTGVLTIVAEAPNLLDPRRVTRESTVDRTELEKIPSARDPWSVLQTMPGVLVDRINVGGNESGQQAQYVGPGSGGDQAVWSLDGMVITDMSAVGSSPGYFDFDAFDEMQVTTGGSDAAVATGGVILNMVTRRGTNDWRGSGRYYLSDSDFQANLEIDESELGQEGPWNHDTAQAELRQGNRIVEVKDYGLELGGPIVRDRLWVWAAYAKPEIELLTINDFSDKTTLENWNGKINAQVTPSNSLTLFGWDSDKVKLGRDAGPLRPQETTYNQSHFGPRPTAYKVEDSQIIGTGFYITGMLSVVNGGFQLVPQGGEKVPFLDDDGSWHNSFFPLQIERPQKQAKADASSFFNTGSLSHELRYGAGYRIAEQSSLARTPGGGWETGGVLLLAREGLTNVDVEYSNLYVQDTLAAGNLTASVGLRYDVQSGQINDTIVSANPVFPELLPEARFAGRDSGFEWSTLTPRMGLTWALGEQKNTLLRASYSRFADQLATGFAGFLNPLGGQQFRYFATTNNGGPTLEPGELGRELGDPSGNLNPFTLQPLQSNAIDPDLEAPVTDEVLLGLEHALRPELVVGLNLSYRRYQGLVEAERLVFDSADPRSPENLAIVGRKHRRDDYIPATEGATGILPNGQTYTVNWYELKPGVTTRDGFLLENGDREQEFKGASLTFHKRLANRWMMRGNASWQDWTWSIPDSENEDPTDTIVGGVVDGTKVLQGSGTVSGSKGNVFLNSGWSYSLNGLYQVAPERPWGFNLSASLSGRQGFPIRYARRIFRDTITDAAGVGLDIPVESDPDAFRYPDVHLVDLRLEKEFSFREVGLTLGADVFNVFNESYVLQRQGLLDTTRSDHVLEILNPRMVRFGARFSFR